MILIDTNVLSEALRPKPEPAVIQWLNRNFADRYLSTVTIFELEAGVAMLTKGQRRSVLETAIARMIQRFGPRIVAFDKAAAHSAAGMLARARKAGSALSDPRTKLADLQTAGICAAYGLSLATRDAADFAAIGLKTINPWTEL